MIEQLQAILAIVLIDLALSGDNALVIGMAARGLPRRQRRMAISIGAGGAVVLRVLAAVVATILLTIPYLQLAGGIVLALIAYRLVRPDDGRRHEVSAARSLPEAIAIILVADAAMSTENILGVAAAAHGDVSLLIFGLALSIPIVLFGSTFVVGLLERFPQVVWIGAAALAWTAADLILGDPAMSLVHADLRAEAVLAVVLLGGIFVARRITQRQRA